MSTLFWAIDWDKGVYPLDTDTKQKLTQVILQKVEGNVISTGEIGILLNNVEVVIGKTKTSFSARLEQIDPPDTFTIKHDTNIEVYLMTDLDIDRPFPSTDRNQEPSPSRDIEEMVMFQRTFNPNSSDLSFYIELYESLIGIPKDSILREMLSLLIPLKDKKMWSMKHYDKLLPCLNTTSNKASVIMLGGDPGTGKTALATSIGAPLAREMGERVHFRHMSLMLRGMGYHGRASGLIVKLFEHIKHEYLELREPIILFFDEAEAIVGTRRGADASSGAQENIAVVDAIIVGVDGLRKGLQARVVALFATNLTDRIDAALMRRSYYYSFERPDENTRYELFKSALRGMEFNEFDLKKIVEATMPKTNSEGVEVPFTHSDIVELIIGRALNEAIRQDKPVSVDMLMDYCLKTIPTGFSGI